MTVITTSRKPFPELRSLTRDLAFSIGGQYLTRGKMGLRELLALDRTVLLVSKQGPILLLQVFCDESPVASVPIRGFSVRRREGAITRGLIISDRAIYESLKRYVDASCTSETLKGHRIVFDGTQRKRYVLELVP